MGHGPVVALRGSPKSRAPQGDDSFNNLLPAPSGGRTTPKQNQGSRSNAAREEPCPFHRQRRAHALNSLRDHEQVHVAQYERWGVFFVPGYLLSSAWLVQTHDADFVLIRQALRELRQDLCDADAAEDYARSLPRITLRVRKLSCPSPFAETWSQREPVSGGEVISPADALARLHAELIGGADAGA